MKTLRTVCIAMMTLLLATCGVKNPTPAEIAGKIDAGQKLTQVDYEVMIKYCGEYAKSAQKYVDIMNGLPGDSSVKGDEIATDWATLRADNPYLDMFRTAIYSADDSALGEKNQKLVKEYEKYSEFPLPDGAGPALQQPGVVGDIEDMPPTAVSDSDGVIATGDGIAVDEKVK